MKRLFYILLGVCVLFSFAGCSNKKEVAQDHGGMKDLDTMTIGILPDVDSIPFVIAQEKGFFHEEGVTVNLEHFKSPVDRDSALQSGNLDGAISDVLAAAFAHDNNFKVKIISMTNGSYKLLAGKDSEIIDLQGLKGKDVAISKNTIIEYTTDQILIEKGLTGEDIHKVVIPKIPARLEMLQNGKIDGATLPEPLATIAIKSGAKLLNSSDRLGINPGVLIFTSQSVEEKAQEIEAMFRAYNKAIDYLKKEPIENYIDLLIEKAGLPEAVRDVIELPDYTKATLPTEKDVVEVIKWLYDKQLIKKQYGFQDLVEEKFVR
ncbi:MetQ/NlpA family ABC transporter substrate-binding protein [Clostridiaceae bacterium 35-E11]